MAKKPAPWSINTQATKQEAKASIEKTIKSEPKKKKKGAGRPKKITKETMHALIHKDAARLAKKIAAIEEIPMTEYLSALVYEDAKKKKIK